MQFPDQIARLNRRPLLLRMALIALAVIVLRAVIVARRPMTPAEQEIELVSRLDRLSQAVKARDGRRIASLLDDAFTDEAGRDKPHAIAALTDSHTIPPLGYRPDREVYTLSRDRQSATVKNTVLIFSNAPKTHRVTAADVTIVTDWVRAGRGWLLHHTHRPIRRAVRIGASAQKARV